jgi:hypothetical protein
MEPTTFYLLLGIAVVLGVISLGMIVLGLRPQAKAEATKMWPPTFYVPLPSDASLLTPRKTQTGTNSMLTLEMKLHNGTADDDEDSTAKQLDLKKISEIAEKTGPKRVGNVVMPDADEATNKNVIKTTNSSGNTPKSTSDPDATNKQTLK